MGYSITKQDSQESYNYKEIFVDTIEEVANVPTTYLPGSELIVRKGPEVFFLVENEDGSRAWKRPEDD